MIFVFIKVLLEIIINWNSSFNELLQWFQFENLQAETNLTIVLSLLYLSLKVMNLYFGKKPIVKRTSLIQKFYHYESKKLYLKLQYAPD